MEHLDNLGLHRVSDAFPITWRRHPDNPLFRGGGYDRFRLTNPDPNRLRDALWSTFPSASKVYIPKEYWRDDYPPLSGDNEVFWTAQTGIKDKKELKQHLHAIRDEAFQVVQEFTIARWWFLRPIISKNPYYAEIIEVARNKATVVDLGCGFGQDLRRLKADGATGTLYGVDCRPEIWKLGTKLFKETGEDSLQFRDIDIVADQSSDNRLAEFTDKVDVYLLNDVLSFKNGKVFHDTSGSIYKASKVGTKVMGWLIGQVGERTENDGREYGDGYRGVIPTLDTATGWIEWGLGVESGIKFEVKAEMVEFEKLGFDQEDQEWFRSEFWNGSNPTERPNELRAICFLATRTQ